MAKKVGSTFGRFEQFVASASEVREYPKFSLGPLSLNLALGDPEGISGGRFLQLWGMPSTGKSTLTLDMIKQWQEKDAENTALLVDFERAFHPDYAQAIGVDTDRLYVARADTTEQGLDIIEAAIDAGVKLIVVDSIAAGMPSTEEEKTNIDNPKMAGNAGLWTRFMQRNVGRVDNRGALIVLINHARKNFSTMSREENVPYGGLAVQFYSAAIIQLRYMGKEDGAVTVEATLKKNREGAPQTRASFSLSYGKGIDHARDIIELAQFYGIVAVGGGGWYTYNNIKVQGMAKAKMELPIDELKERVIEHVKQS